MPDPVTLAISLGVGALVLAREVVSFVRERDKGAAPPSPGPILPPAPPPPNPSQLNLDVPALSARVGVLEKREEMAQAKREEMAQQLTRIETLISERTQRGRQGGGGHADGGQRGSG